MNRSRRAARIAAPLIAAALVVPFAPGGSLAAGGAFAPYTTVAVPSVPDAVAIGDVTGDGRPDLVATTGYSLDASVDFHLLVLEGRADGSLAPAVAYATAGTYPNRPESLALGDISGDGRLDVVVGIAGIGVQLFPQLADGSLGAPTLTPTPDSLRVRLGRFDGNASIDVAGIGWGTGSATVLLNTGGSLGGATTYAVPHDGYDDLETGDVTGDGLDDIVVMSGQGLVPSVSVLPRLAAGGFGAVASYSVAGGELTHGIGLGDVTGDGRADVVASSGGNRPSSHVSVFGGTAAGTLAPPVTYSSLDIPEPVEVADVDRDGRADVITVHGGWNAAGLYRSQADGTLAAEDLYVLPYASHYNPHGLAVGDVTGDGWPDLVIADYNHDLVILRNIAAPSVPGAPTLTAATPGDGRVTLTWTAPASDGGSAISGYTATATPGDATCTVAALGCAITGLANGTTYSFTVRATNAVGSGPASNALSATPARPATVPTAPRSLGASAGKGTISLSWTVPVSDGGSPITAYRVYRGAASGGETLLVTVPAGSRSFIDASVVRKVRYWYRVTALSAIGESVPSNEVNAASK